MLFLEKIKIWHTHTHINERVGRALTDFIFLPNCWLPIFFLFSLLWLLILQVGQTNSTLCFTNIPAKKVSVIGKHKNRFFKYYILLEHWFNNSFSYTCKCSASNLHTIDNHWAFKQAYTFVNIFDEAWWRSWHESPASSAHVLSIQQAQSKLDFRERIKMSS